MNYPSHLLTFLASLLFLCTISLLSTKVNAAYELQTTNDCALCVADGAVSCRPNFYDRYAYCCAPTEVGSLYCGGKDTFCSSEAKNLGMNAFSCPY